MFAPFPVLGFLAFCSRNMGIGRQFILVAGLIAAGAALAIGTEQVQAMLQYRTADIGDLMADAAGISGGVVITFIYIILKRRA